MRQLWPIDHLRIPQAPKEPKGDTCPAEVIGNAVLVARIAAGEVEDTPEDDGKDKVAQELGRKGGESARGIA